MNHSSAFLDMDSIRHIGLSRFSHLYHWPISDDQYTFFVDTTLAYFEEILVQIDQDLFDAVLSDYRFLALILQHIHYRSAANRFQISSSETLNCGPSLKEMLSPNWERHVEYFSSSNLRSGHFGNHAETYRSRVGLTAIHKINTITSNRSATVLNHARNFYGTPQHLSIGPYSRFKAEFLNSLYTYSTIGEWNFFGIPSTTQPDKSFRSRLHSQFLDLYLDFLGKQASAFGASLDKRLLHNAWSRRLTILNSLYNGFRQFRPNLPELSVTAAGNPIRKIFATALRREGTKVYVLHHGDCPGVERYPHAHRNDGSLCDYFVCPTPQVTKNFELNYSGSLISERTGTRYICSRGDQFKTMRTNYRRASSSGRIRTVMLIGYGMNHTRYLDGAGYFSYFQLDLQYRVARLIKESEFKLIYKVHPDRVNEVGTLFAEYSDSVETRPFEEVWDEADSYVFTHPGTTVFGHAVFSDKPILLVDLCNNNWNLDGYRLLKKRCHMVSSEYDCDNRIIFDETELMDKLQNPLALNDDYVNQLLLESLEPE
jgi:hypothetical protein